MIKRGDKLYGYVYITTNEINGKQYIGKKVSPRFVPSYKGSGEILLKAIAKYGKENFSTSILQEYESKEDLEAGERKWIAHFNAVESKQFYNISRGGNGFDLGITKELLGEERYQEYIKNLSNGVKQSYDSVPGLRELRSQQLKERRPYMHNTEDGKRRHKEAMQRIRENRTEEEKAAIVAKQLATYHSRYAEHSVWENKTHPWTGKHHSEATKKKLAEYGKKLTGTANPNAKPGYITYNNEVVFSFSLKRDAYDYLRSVGLTKAERGSMSHGEVIKGYQIHTKSATTIESLSKEGQVE